jgi:hypothetical protein
MEPLGPVVRGRRTFTPEQQREKKNQQMRDIWAAKTPQEKRAQQDRENASRPSDYLEKKREKAQAKEIYTPHESVTVHTSDEIVKILGGAMPNAYHQSGRGFMEWKPGAVALKLVTEVQSILEEYRAHLPLTVRQILYRLMGKHGHEKTIESALYETCRRARRARIIEMDAIRDDGGVQEEKQSWDDAEQWIGAIRGASQTVRLDRQDGQKKRLAVYCEAAGMVPQLARVANEYGVPVFSSGGFDSLTEKHLFGRDRNGIEVLHIGDFDPSGIWMFIALAEDISAFADEYGNTIDFTRIAVTPEQIEKLGLATQDMNPDDKRAFPGTITAQAEAIAPDELARILRKAIEDRFNMKVYRAVLKQEKALHEELGERLDNA